MGNNHNIKIENIIDLKEYYSNSICSDFFLNLFENSITEIKIEDKDREPLVINIKINFKQETANYFNIVHGGSIAILFENITNMILFFLTKKFYNTKDIGIIFKRQVALNVDYNLKIKIEKLKYKTVFVHCYLINNKNEETTEANIIKELIPQNKM